jgi:TolA-binding protein
MNATPVNTAPMNVPTFDPSAGGNFNYDVPTFQPPPLAPPALTQGGDEKVALNGIGNAYSPFSGTGQSGGAVPAFQAPGVQESLASQGLVARARERSEDRRREDQKFIDTCDEIRDKKNTDAWKVRMPPYAGPLENRTGDASDFIQVGGSNSLMVKQDDYEYDWEREEKHYFDFSMLDPSRFSERVKVWVGLGPNEEKARKHFDKGLELMKDKGQYSKAAGEFEWAAYYCPKTALEEDARYHAAECYYQDKRFAYAVKQYTLLLENFPSSPYKTEAITNMYEIARTWIKQVTEDKVSYVNVSDRSRPTFDTFGYAERALKTIFMNCPSDPMAAESLFLLAHGHMRLGRAQGDASFEHAAEYFKQLRDCYPNSERVVEAMRLEVVCREKAGLGANYDPRHIDEARLVADQLLGQYSLPADQKDEIVEIRNHLNEEKAKNLWVIAKFWDDRYDYGAARLGYREIIEKYPATSYADKARQRYEQIQDRPAELPSDWQRIMSVFKVRWQ